MNIRDYADMDLPRIQELHQQSNLGYSLPDMNTFFSKKVVEGDGDIGMAVFQRLNTEVFLICNPKWRTPAWRLAAIKNLDRVCGAEAFAAGAREALAFVPPVIEETFHKRLAQMGWLLSKPYWNCWYKAVV